MTSIEGRLLFSFVSLVMGLVVHKLLISDSELPPEELVVSGSVSRQTIRPEPFGPRPQISCSSSAISHVLRLTIGADATPPVVWD